MPGTVTVACNLPNGIVLQLCAKREESEVVMGGGTRLVDRWRPTGSRVRINGNAHPVDKGPRHQIVGASHPGTGYALTHNVDADFWEAWLKQNATAALVLNRCIFAAPKQDAVEDRARGLAPTQRSGLEPIDPSRPLPGMAKVEAAVRA